MAWQLRRMLLGAFTFLASASLSYAAPTCGKVWLQLPASTQVINGKVLGFENASDMKSGTIKQYDFDGKLVKEFKAPRSINYLRGFKEAGDGFVYLSGEKLYHFDPKTNQDHEIGIGTSGNSYCSSNGLKSSVLKFCSSSDQKVVYDFKSHNKIEIPNPKHADVVGQTIAYSESVGDGLISKVSVYDFATGKKQTFDVPPASRINTMSENQFLISDDRGENLVNMVKVDGKWTKIADQKSRKLTGVLADGSLVFGSYKHKSGKDVEVTAQNAQEFTFTTEIFDKTGKTKKNTLNGYYMRSYNGGAGFVKAEFPQKYSTYSEKDFNQLAAGKSVKPAYESKDYPMISRSGNFALIHDPSTQASSVVNLKNKKMTKLPGKGYYYNQESENGKNLYIGGQGNSAMVLDTATGKLRKFNRAGNVQFDENYEKWAFNKNQLSTLKEVCMPDTVKVIEDDCDCLIKNAESENKPLSSESLGNLQDIALAALCQAPAFDAKAWDKIAPSLSKGEISKKQAKLYLKRFQQMDGYQSKQHEAILSAILKSDLVEKEPGLVTETLKTISSNSPSEVGKLYSFFKLDKRLPKDFAADESNVCKGKLENMAVSGKISQLKMKAAQTDLRSTTEDWVEYKPFRDELRKLPESEREAIVDGIAESLSQNAGASADLNGVFQSKLYYFSKKHALDVMGGKAKPATDLAIAVSEGKNTPIVMGSGEIAGGTSVDYEDSLQTDIGQFGFNYKALDSIEISEKAKVGTKISKKISWQHDGQKFSADTQVKVLEPLGKLIPKDKAPNYAALKKDGKLTGMMIIGSNLSAGHAQIVDEYITYYQNQGFEFKEPEKVDAVSQFKNSVKSGELDYLIKEAHSDGDEKNLFRANTAGKLYTGTLTKSDGVKEVIYLMAPDAEDHKSQLISNQEFGSWIRDRKKDQPLFYLNASCNSARKVVSEVAAAHSPNFLPIPSDSSVRTFSDSERSGERQILQSFREGKDYEGIRENLKKSGYYQQGEDKFVFPDEERYDTAIRNNLKMNLDIEVKVKDSKGKEIHMDENVDH